MIENKVAQAFDEFIRSTGGNLDPRGNCNRQRFLLFTFFRTLQELMNKGITPDQIQDCMLQIISNKTTSEDFKSDKGFTVYDHLLERVETG